LTVEHKAKWRAYSREDIAEIRRLVSTGLSYAAVAERIGRSHASVKVAMMKAGRGQLEFKRVDQLAFRDTLVQQHKAGKSVEQIAGELGWTVQRVVMRLRRAEQAGDPEP
jgi:IS30 family transposase